MSDPGQPGTASLSAFQLGAAFFALALVPLALAMQLGPALVDEPLALRREGSFLCYAVGCVIVLGLQQLTPRPQPWRPARLRAVSAVYLPFFVVWSLLLLGYLRLLHWLGHAVPPQEQMHYLAAGEWSRPGFWLAAVTVVGLGPLAEEILFRGYLHSLLRQRLSAWPAIGLGGLLFGAMHPLGTMLPIALLGMLFGWLRERHGSLWPSCWAHMLHNLLQVALIVAWPGAIDWLYPQ